MINGIYWDSRSPAFFTLEDMRKPDFKIKTIADVTCDIAPSSIPSTIKANTIDEPVYDYQPESRVCGRCRSCRLNLRPTHVSLFDGSLQGVARTDVPAFSLQGHPEASPGPHDVAYLFDRFISMQARRPKGSNTCRSVQTQRAF